MGWIESASTAGGTVVTWVPWAFARVFYGRHLAASVEKKFSIKARCLQGMVLG